MRTKNASIDESENERVTPSPVEPVRTGFRFRDFVVLVFCVSGILFFLFLFRHDLFQTIYLQNVQPVGNVVLRSNVVQRRISDRVLWDRLLSASSLYIGDIIRVAEHSSAALDIEGQQIFLNENTLIRIQRAPDGEGLQIELSEGSLSVATNEDGGNLQINVMGQILETSAGSAFNVTAGNNGIVVKVNEGAARFIDESGRSREISSGSMLALDPAGAEQMPPAAVVTRPRANVQFLKSTAEPLPVSFAWNRINLAPDDYLRLEIAEDRNFNRITQTIEELVDTARSSLDLGIWHWRLSFEDNVLTFGRFSVVESSGPELISPIGNSLIRFRGELPSVRFQWSEVEEASLYFLEVSLVSDFSNTQISHETSATSYIQPELGQGTWYWRVMPVFSSGYEGESSFSAISQFRITHTDQNPAEEERVVLPEPPTPPPEPLELRLVSPAQGTNITGLNALRSPTVFRWDSDRETVSSRFVLSRNINPLQQPVTVINNPGRNFQVNRIDAGVWYWTVEATSAEGIVSSAPPRQLQVLPIPALPAPANLLPPNGHQLEIEAIKTRESINFSWQPVPGANAYIITLFEQTGAGRHQVFRSSPQTQARWTLEDLSVLSINTFFWQVEAVNVRQNGIIDQRGAISENFFIVDFPLPEVQAIRPGVLYGQ